MIDQRFRLEPTSTPMPAADRAAALAAPGFGKVFTDHMLVLRYNPAEGWHDGVIRARAPFQIDPACSVLHYAQEIFEGMKAYRTPDDGAALFRSDANARRFAKSAERMAMPQVPEELFQAAVRSLVEIERDWLPEIGHGALYLRPFMFPSEVFLGVRPATEYLFVIIASPAGAYFKGGASGLTLWLSDQYVRAAPGGTGTAKCGGNYAAGLLAQSEAIAAGCDQVLFLDAIERRWVEELGGMNVFFVFAEGSLVTPPLGGTILPGITRDSLITVARGLGHEVREEPYSIEQWQDDAGRGHLVEAFACGTAAVVSPIGHVKGSDRAFSIADGRPGPVTAGLRTALFDIQHGTVPDPHGWLEKII